MAEKVPEAQAGVVKATETDEKSAADAAGSAGARTLGSGSSVDAAATAKILVFGLAYIGISMGLINFNKFLMREDNFPFSGGLGFLHSTVCGVFAWGLFILRPDWFPSLSGPGGPNAVFRDIDFLSKAVLPIAVCFSVQIVLSNQAYLFADVAFLQMLKESNVVAVYMFSVLFAIESFSWTKLRLIMLIVLATWMTIKGELKFTLAGLLLQGSSFFFESMKITLQGLMLSNAGRRLDPLTYLVVVMPMCTVIFGSVLLFFGIVMPADQNILPVPTIADWVNNWKLLSLNATLAFSLNLIAVFFIKASSAVAYVLTGIIKDVIIVVTGVLFFGHECSTLQAAGFTLQVSLILVWSLLKTFPARFEHGILSGLVSLLPAGEPEEATARAPVKSGGEALLREAASSSSEKAG